MFDKFIRAKNAHNINVTGTGLGLYVAKKMVEEMKGKVWAESEGEKRVRAASQEVVDILCALRAHKISYNLNSIGTMKARVLRSVWSGGRCDWES